MKSNFNIEKIKKDMKAAMDKATVGLKKMGKETSVFAKRSEKELSKITRVGKAEVDMLGLNIKKNQLFYELGKKVYQLNTQGKLNTKKLKKYCGKIEEIEKTLRGKKRAVSRYMKTKK